MINVQPAKRSYFLYDSFIDLGNVIKGAFKYCEKSIAVSAPGLKKAWQPMKYAYGFWGKLFCSLKCLFGFGIALANVIFTLIFTPLICGCITVIQLTILISFYAVASIFVGAVILADWVYCQIHKIVSHCPNCQAKFTLPMYVCECGNKHNNLRPGIYGIFKRECNCGRILSTSFLNGRNKHDAHCPACGYDIADDITSSVCIPIIGGANSGKTCYVNMTMLSIQKNAARYGLSFAYEKNDRDEYENNVSAYLSKGKYPPKTQDMDNLTYYQFALTPPGAIKQMISLCDVAGELYDIQASGDNITKQKGLRFANAFILIIDPLSITEYRNEVAKTMNLTNYRGSKQPIDEVVDTLINTLQNIFNVKAADLLKTEVAVVFTKADIPGLSQLIGRDAILKNTPSTDIKAKYETQNKLCEDFLKRYNEANFLRILKRFKNVQFFTCSALGHPENGQAFVPVGVEEPFFWLVKKVNVVIAKAVK